MGDLLRDNNCKGCDFFDMEANDYYYQWCMHPALGENPDKYISYEERYDFRTWVKLCPLTNKSPYE